MSAFRIDDDIEDDMLGFKWDLQSYESKSMTIKIDFENPLQISKYEI